MAPKPIALTIGEPSGVGPELAEMAWAGLGQDVDFFVIGDPAHLPGKVPVNEISSPSQTHSAIKSGLPVLPLKFPAPNTWGTPTPENATMVIKAIEIAVDLAQRCDVSAICTNPINKKALIDGAAFAYPGHTEFLADLAGVDQVVMMLASPQLKVVPTTIHIALSQVPKVLTPGLLRKTIEITARAMQSDFGIPNPKIAVSGLNPHAGEGGTMGHEDSTLIAPTLDKLRETGIDIIGPLSADTMFHAAARSSYDVAVAMYHDQALIPIKTLAFDEGVNVTLGLPFVRTSPDHGTAFDIAGQGIARPDSLIAALRTANEMARARGEK